MGKRYLIDSNVLLDFLEEALPASGQSFVANIIDADFNVSIINRIELLGYKDVTEQTIQFIGLATIHELSVDIAEATIELRKENKIKLPDAIIAATAKVNGFIVLTRNKRDFQNIKGLAALDPYSL